MKNLTPLSNPGYPRYSTFPWSPTASSFAPLRSQGAFSWLDMAHEQLFISLDRRMSESPLAKVDFVWRDKMPWLRSKPRCPTFTTENITTL